MAEFAPQSFQNRRRWFFHGVIMAFSIPGLILAVSFVGFAGLAREAGLTVQQTLFMTAIVWALPAKVVLIGAIMSGATLPAAALAVAFSSVRLMPMVIALLPELRGARTPRWVFYALSHFVAVTSWVLAMERLRSVPPEMRTSCYAGLGSTLILLNMAVVAVTFAVAETLPPMASASLLFLTPMYFLTSLWASSRERAGHFAMAFGMVLGPVFHVLAPGIDLLAGGLIGGTAAYGAHRLLKAGRRT
ncbi:AzlC family ABC transporter permease [Arvimicrobium flavum]|uniref:AzlC family ABC transporter permease n=1 Tax=Arvimicrobium flavum TaxID=3393320 RepID=UPI00237B9205|nr:AzlC family ABC transporter permease [Mesorhizobium shangrilense]